MAKWTVGEIPDQAGRSVLVTGASSGLGLRAAEALASRGARVLMGCRNPEKAAVALAAVKSVAQHAAPEVVPLDLSDLEPAAFGATTGQGEWKIFQDFLKNPKNVNGIAASLETAAAKAYKAGK